jgi:hypothetical protein
MKTAQEKYVAEMRASAKKAGRSLGPLAQAATRRPANYSELSSRSQWDIDKTLGILDWDGSWER